MSHYINVSFNVYLNTQRKTMNTTVHLLAKIWTRDLLLYGRNANKYSGTFSDLEYRPLHAYYEAIPIHTTDTPAGQL